MEIQARHQKSYEYSDYEFNNRPEGPMKDPFWRLLLMFIGLALIFVIAYMSERNGDESDFIVEENGKVDLAPWRKEKLDRELDEIDEAVQYALIVTKSGEYRCFSCPDGRRVIHLEVGHTWRYGTTRKGEVGRYRGQLPDVRLLFVEQFKGSLSECLKEEKRKIYFYALLPENLSRKKPLIRPPGNKNDT